MKLLRRNTLAGSLAALLIGSASVHVGGFSDGVAKIGVLSGQFSHESGEGSVTAIKMAIEDYVGKVLENKPNVASVIALVRSRKGRHDRESDQFLNRTRRFTNRQGGGRRRPLLDHALPEGDPDRWRR